MNFPGKCELTLSDDAIKQAIEDALNSTRMAGEDRVYVTEVSHGYGPWRVSITTDVQSAEVTELQVAA